jgi:hypothetical protein
MENSNQGKEPEQPPKKIETFDIESQAEPAANKSGILRHFTSSSSRDPSDSQTPEPSANDIQRRRRISILLSIILAGYVGLPVRFISWVYGYESAHVRLLDDVLSHAILGAGFWFHFRMASLTQRANPGDHEQEDWLLVCAFWDGMHIVVSTSVIWWIGGNLTWARRTLALPRIVDRLLYPFYDLSRGKRFIIKAGIVVSVWYFSFVKLRNDSKNG